MSKEIDEAIVALKHQQQCDEDGIMCIVSRQAVNEVIDYYTTLKNRNKAVDVENLRKGIKIITEAYEHLSQDGTYCEATIETDFNNCKNEMRAVRDFIANGYLQTPDTIQVKRDGAEDLAKRLKMKADVISMCEKIEWGSDTALMYEAATLLSEKQNEE
jgi:hypothetical protein